MSFLRADGQQDPVRLTGIDVNSLRWGATAWFMVIIRHGRGLTFSGWERNGIFGTEFGSRRGRLGCVSVREHLQETVGFCCAKTLTSAFRKSS